MGNACFRCRTSIQSGKTFCHGCRSEVSLGDAGSGDRSRWWFAIVGGCLGLVLSLTVAIVGLLLEVTVVVPSAILATLVFAFVQMLGLHMDVRALQGRPDAEWSPSEWDLLFVLFFTLFVFPAPFVALFYLYYRRGRVGLPR